ncbi:hypothetical protein J6590_071483 [Homalodisca vitripennis]|nr:hypothetical protein J6590_071483 [Homalodisca vitripennis]
MEGQSNPIYVNNSLTQANRKLLNTAREVKREKQYTYLWVRNRRIFMRKNPGDRFAVIDSMEVLNSGVHGRFDRSRLLWRMTVGVLARLNKGVSPPAYFDWRGWFRAGLPFFRDDFEM